MAPSINIAALTRRTGIPSDTIRKWEQRYGVLSPQRTSGGQRRYSELDVARIEWLKARLAEGYRISEAATLLGGSGRAPLTDRELRASILAATEAGDVGALASLVDQSVARPSLEQAFVDVLSPALTDVGDRWQSGTLTVAQEHLATSAVRAALEKLLSDPRPDLRGAAVLACAPGERHEIGLLMLAVLLRADCWQVAFLGADTPAADALALAAGLHARALCFSASTKAHAEALDAELARERVPEALTVLVGGRGTDRTDLRGTVEQLHTLTA
jgi:MerR family transcriptional regulator, light-induced transcriptional regulator